MTTRCTITVQSIDGKKYRIYRHHDGNPECVVSDLHLFMQFYKRSPVEDPEYFLANFICMAKMHLLGVYLGTLTGVMKVVRAGPGSSWNELLLSGYGVCAPDCEHGDLEYKYLIYPKDGKVMLKIEKFDYGGGEFREAFNDEIRGAFKRWAREDGCHLIRAWIEKR